MCVGVVLIQFVLIGMSVVGCVILKRLADVDRWKDWAGEGQGQETKKTQPRTKLNQTRRTHG